MRARVPSSSPPATAVRISMASSNRPSVTSASPTAERHSQARPSFERLPPQIHGEGSIGQGVGVNGGGLRAGPHFDLETGGARPDDEPQHITRPAGTGGSHRRRTAGRTGRPTASASSWSATRRRTPDAPAASHVRRPSCSTVTKDSSSRKATAMVAAQVDEHRRLEPPGDAEEVHGRAVRPRRADRNRALTSSMRRAPGTRSPSQAQTPLSSWSEPVRNRSSTSSRT